VTSPRAPGELATCPRRTRGVTGASWRCLSRVGSPVQTLDASLPRRDRHVPPSHEYGRRCGEFASTGTRWVPPQR
jgi:hypothetical protein